MGKGSDRNLLFAVLAVQLRGVAPEKVIEVAGAWATNPTEPLSTKLQQAGYITAEDVALLEKLVDQMVATCRGDVDKALATIRGGRDIMASIGAGASPDATRPMDEKFPFDLEAEELSVIDESDGRYSQISEYGRGGMGRVLLVHDQFLGREIALKELLLPHGKQSGTPAPIDSPMRDTTARLARFVQEARITGQLEHPGIVPVYELGRRKDGTFYYTMRLVRGNTLEKALKKATNLEERLRLLPHVVDLCQALAYAHSRCVIHRDIKPANLMIGEFGETVLLDWGLAKIRGKEDVYAEKLSRSLQLLRVEATGATPQTEEGEAVGTPHYMPPEQARGLVEELDERSDVYSVGAVIYEMLTGQPPFTGRSPEAVLFQVIEKQPKRINLLVNGAPPELVSICEKAMSKDPDNRYQSMKQLRDELLRFQTGAFVQAYKYTPGQVIGRYYKKHRLVLNTTAAAAIALFAMGIYSYINIYNAHKAEHTQRLAAEEARNEAITARDEAAASEKKALRQQYLAQLHLAQGYIENHQLRMANEALNAAPESERDWAWGFLMNEINPDKFTVRSAKSTILTAKYDPAGERIVALRDAEPPGLWSASDGSHLLDFQGEPLQYTNASFNQDGTVLAAAGYDGSVHVWNTADGKRLQTLPYGSKCEQVIFGGNPRSIWASYADGTLLEWNVEDGQQLRKITTDGGLTSILLFSESANILISVGQKLQAQAWDYVTGERVWAASAEYACLSPDGTVVVLSLGNDVGLYETTTGQKLQPLNGHTNSLFHVEFSRDSERVLTVSKEAAVRLYTRNNPDPAKTYLADEGLTFTCFGDGESRILGATTENTYYVWDTESTAELFRFRGEDSTFPRPDLSPDGRHLLINSFRAFKVLDVLSPKGQTAALQPLHEKLRVDLAVATNAARAAALWSGKAARVYSLPDVRQIAEFEVKPIVSTIAISPDGAKLVYWQDDKTLTVGNVDTQEKLLTYSEHSSPITSMSMAQDGSFVASCDSSGNLRVWNLETGSTMAAVELGTPAHALAISIQYNQVAAGCDDGVIRFVNIDTGSTVRTIDAHPTAVMALALQVSEKMLASSGRDGSLAFWDFASGASRAIFPAEEGNASTAATVHTARFSSDDRYLFTRTSADTTLTVDTTDFGTPLQRSLIGKETVLVDTGLLTVSRDGVVILRDVTFES